MQDRRDPVARWRDTEFGRKIRTTRHDFGSSPSLQRPLWGHCSFASSLMQNALWNDLCVKRASIERGA